MLDQFFFFIYFFMEFDQFYSGHYLIWANFEPLFYSYPSIKNQRFLLL